MSELIIHASPALPRFVPMSPQEITEARRRVAASLKSQSGFEPVGVVSARVVGALMAVLQKDAA